LGCTSEVRVSCIGEENMHTEFYTKNLKERDCFEELSLDRSIILKCTLKKQDGKVLADFIWLRIGRI
jgi:hypothetical protein